MKKTLLIGFLLLSISRSSYSQVKIKVPCCNTAKDTIYIQDSILVKDSIGKVAFLDTFPFIIGFNIGYFNYPTVEFYFSFKEYQLGISGSLIQGCPVTCGKFSKFVISPYVERFWEINNNFYVGARLTWKENFQLAIPVGYKKNLRLMLSPIYKGGKKIDFGLQVMFNKEFTWKNYKQD